MGGRKCGAFLSLYDRDPHPTCARCRGKICTKDMTCDFCVGWSPGQWELFSKKRTYKERKSRPSGSVPPAPGATPRAGTSSKVPQPGTSSSSFSHPSGGQDNRVHLVLCPGRLPSLPLGLGRAKGGGGVGSVWICASGPRARLCLFCPFGSWRGGSCSFAADSPCPHRFLGCFSPLIAARSAT